MAKTQRNLIGQRFGKLSVLESCGVGADRHYYSKVRCDCGKEYLVPDTELIYNRRSQCKDCSKPTKTHGMTKTRLFDIWQSMKQRCYDQNNCNYKYYGARGIKVCDEWKHSFVMFHDWAISHGYDETLTIERIDVNGDYHPNNCKWITQKEQANNKRTNYFIEYKGEKYTIAQLSEKCGVKYRCLYWRIRKGWDIEKAVSMKPIVGRNQYEKI